MEVCTVLLTKKVIQLWQGQTVEAEQRSVRSEGKLLLGSAKTRFTLDDRQVSVSEFVAAASQTPSFAGEYEDVCTELTDRISDPTTLRKLLSFIRAAMIVMFLLVNHDSLR